MVYTKASFYTIALTGMLTIVVPGANAEMESLEDQELRAVTGGSALQYSATDISYNLSQLTGIDYSSGSRTETRTATERVDATVHRLQINGSGEIHAYAEEFTLGDYSGSNNSIYKTADGQSMPDNALRNFGFGNSAEDPFRFEDPYIEVQKQRHADGTETIRGIRLGFGKADGHTPLTIDSTTGYISTLSIIPELEGLVKAQVYGAGTKDTFVSLLGEIPDGSGNYPQTGPGQNTSGALAPPDLISNMLNSLIPGTDTLGLSHLTGLLGDITESNIATQGPGGKELNLEHVRSLDFKNVDNFYISMNQGGGNSMVNADGTVNGAMWSQHLKGVIPESRPDLPGWNMVMPFNDPNNVTAGYVEAHTDLVPALSQILLGIGDDNPRQSYQPVF